MLVVRLHNSPDFPHFRHGLLEKTNTNWKSLVWFKILFDKNKMFQNQSEHYWCILFRLSRPDGIKHVQAHYIVVMRTKHCRPLSKPKSVPLPHWESEAEQTYPLIFTQTKGNVKHCIPGGEISQVKWYCTWDPIIMLLTYQFPAAREDPSALQKLKVTCQALSRSPQVPSHSSGKA